MSAKLAATSDEVLGEIMAAASAIRKEGLLGKGHRGTYDMELFEKIVHTIH